MQLSGCRKARALAAGLVVLSGMLAGKGHADSVAQQPNKNGTAQAKHAPANPTATLPIFALDAGLAGPPIVARDGSWWAIGREGQLVHLAPDDTVDWAIGVGAAISGEAMDGDNGLVFLPTANDQIVAAQLTGTLRWRSRTIRGVEGPLAWVAGQGLIFVGRDWNVYWLSGNASLIQTQRLRARRSAGPTAVGAGFAIGTESGELLIWSNRNTPARVALQHPIHAIIGGKSSLLVLAGPEGYAFTARGQMLWHRSRVLGLGHTAFGAGSSATSVIVTDTGRVEWLDGTGEVAASMEGCSTSGADTIPELVATNECAWVSSNSGILRQCCLGCGVKHIALARVPLQRPVLDTLHHRVLVSSSEREVWSVPFSQGTKCE